ncbi:MAG TPA: hypothetical protein DDZ51_19845 [Planctomycetaceae bacterium]|nr:hypothetical protein [Planctomycetaceae bacterium]
MFPVTDHDFRTVGRGAGAEYHFEFTNPFKEDVRVSSVRTSCGCVTPAVTQNMLKSLEKAAVIAKFNTDTYIGDRSATVTVVFDKPFYNEVQLKVRGNIRTDVTFSPSEVNFGELLAGQVKRQEVLVTYTGGSNWEIKDVRSLCSDLTVALPAPERSPGMVRYRMVIGTKDSLPEGDIRERLTLITNDQRFPTIDMSVLGRVRPSLEISPASVNLGQMSAGMRVEKRLVVRAEQEFEVTKAESLDPRFTFELPKGKSKLHFVKVFFTADNNSGSVSRLVEITTDLGSKPKKAECLFTCTISQ